MWIWHFEEKFRGLEILTEILTQQGAKLKGRLGGGADGGQGRMAVSLLPNFKGPDQSTVPPSPLTLASSPPIP